jgi:hypothetical protein
MKRLLHIIPVCFLLLFFSSCLTTLHPIFHEKDVVFNQKLLGYWSYREDEKKKFMQFGNIPEDRRAELAPAIRTISNKGYLVSWMDGSGIVESQCFVFLARIGKNHYLDYYPAETPAQKKVERFYKDHFVKVHASYRIDFKDGDHFVMKRFDKDFLDKLISDNKINIRHVLVDGKNIITASTDDLQKFIVQYGNDPRAFATETVCERSVNY